MLILPMKNLDGFEIYDFKKVHSFKEYLYFFPFFLIVSVNLWNGINTYVDGKVALLHILTMMNEGVIEEVIYQGFLFRSLQKKVLG